MNAENSPFSLVSSNIVSSIRDHISYKETPSDETTESLFAKTLDLLIARFSDNEKVKINYKEGIAKAQKRDGPEANKEKLKDLLKILDNAIVLDRVYMTQNIQSIADHNVDEQKRNELRTILNSNEATKGNYSISYSNDNKTIFIKTLKESSTFQITKEQDEDYFSYIENPRIEPKNAGRYGTWLATKLIFQKWLSQITNDQIKKNSQSNVEKQAEEPARIIYKPNGIYIKDTHDIVPVLGVGALSEEVVKVINNLKSEPGNMVGIFGPWGRGKTFFMNQIWTLLMKDDAYVRVNFHAWRYQHTPATWAYLYEQFSDTFLGSKRKGLKSFINYHLNLWSLNIEREGTLNIWLSIIITFLGVGLYLLVEPFQKWAWNLFALLFSPFLVFCISFLYKNLRLDYLTKALNLIKKYNHRTSFKDNLGIQADIQKELISLINVWVRESKKKIVLVVDDLDRCNEEKTIEIIDSLRIILDEENIKDKLIIIAAIDERILQRAVSNKYKDEKRHELVREYIDKLFIFSIKLGSLDHRGCVEYFTELVKNDLQLDEIETRKTFTFNLPGRPNNDISQKTEEQFHYYDKLTKNEVFIFERSLRNIKDPTPRRIRILYYRYLLTKNLLINKHATSKSNCYWFTDNKLEVLIQLLIFFCDKEIDEIGKQKLDARNHNERKRDPFDETLFNLNIQDMQEVDADEYIELLNVFEIVIAY